MMSAWKEPPSGDDRAEGQIGPDENQLEMFEGAPHGGAKTLLPPMADLLRGAARPEGDGRQGADMMDVDASGRGLVEASGADPDELRRLEDSIRWLMNEGGVRHLPRAATLPPVRGLPPIEVDNPDSLLLNPDSLFPPRSSHRRSGVTRGVVKFLLASAVAAPTAYFIANWLQRTGTAAPSDTAAIAGSFEDRIAAVAPTPKRPPFDGTRIADEILGAPAVEPMITRGIPPMETSPIAAVGANAAEATDARERSAGVSAAPPDPAPIPRSGGEVVVSSQPPARAAPPKPVMSAQEIAAMVERGRVLFESGDLAAARLFFRRAANAGDAAAALAMGATYDPDVLAKRFIRGIGADAEEARTWYEKARELGSPEGPRRIEMLAHR